MIEEELSNLENFLNRALKVTADITDLINSKSDLENISELLDNRERLISVITHFHDKIVLYPESQRSNHSIKINRLSQYIEILIENGLEIEALLEVEKKEMQNQIAKVFKNKENLKGYNLNNIK